MRVLVTGARGRIGRVLVATLCGAGHDVRALDSRPPDNEPPDPPVPTGSGMVEDRTADLRDATAIAAAVAGTDAVVHAGAIPTLPPGQEREVLEINVAGTWNVLLGCVAAGVQRVVYFSSVNALGVVGGYGPPDYLPFDDAHARRPMHAYQLSKHLGEEICRSFTALYAMTTVCLRPVYVSAPARDYVGWYDRPHIDDVANGWVWREFAAYVDVRDVADAAMRGLTVDRAVLGGGTGHDAFLLAADDTGVTVPTAELVAHHFPDVPWRGPGAAEWLADAPYRTLVDTSHASQLLGWRPRHTWHADQATAPAD